MIYEMVRKGLSEVVAFDLKFNKDFLVVHWLRIYLAVQGDWFQSLDQDDPTGCEATKPVCCNY